MSEPFDPLDRATRVLRESPAMDPSAKHRLLARLREEPVPHVSAPRRAWRWLARPRTVVVSPIAGLAVAASLVLALVLRPDAEPVTTAPAVASVPEAVAPDQAAATLAGGSTPIKFVFIAPTASTVSLVGDFNGWDPEATPLRLSDGVWVVDVPLDPGRHVYSFIVDGRQWYADPQAARAPEGGMDAPSSVVLVGRSL